MSGALGCTCRKKLFSMKYFRYTCLIAALIAAVTVSSCGSGHDEERSYVTVRQLESGSAGFLLMGTGGSLRVISNGTAGNEDVINNTGVTGNLFAPLPTFSRDPEDNRSPWVVPEGWEETAPIAEQSKILSGRLVSNGQVVAEIDSMVYSIEEGGDRAHLQMTFAPGNTNAFNSSLAYFFGCITTNDVPGLGNVSSVWVDTTNKRVIVPSSNGAAVHVWFDYTTGRCLVQMLATAAIDIYTWSDEDGNYHSESGAADTRAIFSTEGAVFRKIMN